MNVKLLLTLALIGYATAAALGGQNIVTQENGRIVEVRSQNGAKVTIIREKSSADPAEVDIILTNPQGERRSIQVRDAQGARRVAQILSGYRGEVNSQAFDQILRQVDDLVRNGEVSSIFSEALRGLDNEQSLSEPRKFYSENYGNSEYRKSYPENYATSEPKKSYPESYNRNFESSEDLDQYYKDSLSRRTNDVASQPMVQRILEAEGEIKGLSLAQKEVDSIIKSLEQQIAEQRSQVDISGFGQQTNPRSNQGWKQDVSWSSQKWQQGNPGSTSEWSTPLGSTKKAQIQRQALIEDILRKQAKLQAFIQAQEDAEETKNILKAIMAHEQTQQKNKTTNQQGQQPSTNKMSRIQTLTEAQQKADAFKEILEQEIAQDQFLLNGRVEQQKERVTLNQTDRWWQNSTKQVEYRIEALLESILKKEGKIEAVNQVQEEIEITKDRLRQEVGQQQGYGAGQWGFSESQENLATKAAQIEILTETQEKAEATKNILQRQITQQRQTLAALTGETHGKYLAEQVFGNRILGDEEKVLRALQRGMDSEENWGNASDFDQKQWLNQQVNQQQTQWKEQGQKEGKDTSQQQQKDQKDQKTTEKPKN